MDVGIDNPFIAPAQQFLRLGPTTYNVLLFGFFALAAIAATARTVLRIRKFRTIELDDIFLAISVVLLGGGVFSAFYARDLAYLQMSVSLGLISRPPDDFTLRMMTFEILNDVSGILTWLSIFTVKLAFLLFFKKLLRNVRYLGTYWWVCLALIVGGGLTSAGLGFYICPHFGPDAEQICGLQTLEAREGVYLEVTSAIDILTDLLVISIPVALLWNVQINLRRKLALGTVCSLSAVMIVLALIRTLLAPVKSPVDASAPRKTDTLWLFAFHNVEGAVAIIMVSITAFRSMLGQKGYSRKASAAASELDPVHFAAQPPPVMSMSMSGARSTTDSVNRSFMSVSDATASQVERERNQSVWSMPAFQPRPSSRGISAPTPVPPPKDPRGPLPPRRQFGSYDSYTSTEGARQAPPPHAFV